MSENTSIGSDASAIETSMPAPATRAAGANTAKMETPNAVPRPTATVPHRSMPWRSVPDADRAPRFIGLKATVFHAPACRGPFPAKDPAAVVDILHAAQVEPEV
jgi:hypothetical protein